jgi:hypothetical protein
METRSGSSLEKLPDSTKPGTNLNAPVLKKGDISIWEKRGHLYFGLTEKSSGGFFACFPLYFLLPRNTLNIDQGGIVMEYQGWSFTDSYFWFGSCFGLPGRGEVC